MQCDDECLKFTGARLSATDSNAVIKLIFECYANPLTPSGFFT